MRRRSGYRVRWSGANHYAIQTRHRMQPKGLKSNWAMPALAVLVILATGAGIGQADAPEPPKPLPEKIVAAWKKAGATVGWARPTTIGFLRFAVEKESKPGDVPAFRFNRWPEGGLAKLPAPT